MSGTYNSEGRGISWQQAWTLLHTARSDAERNTWEELFFDGRDTPGNVNLLGQAAVTRIPDIHKLGGKEIALTGQATTATAGSAIGQETFEFTVDTMTGTNGTAITSHTGEVGATWTDVGAGTVATIQTNRLRPASDSTGVNMYTASGTPSDANYAVAADIYMIAWNGNAAWQYLDVGVMARYSSTNGGECYAFGWDAYFGGWALYKLYAGSWGMISINQSYDSTRAAGDARTIELFVEGTTNPRLRGWVNGVLVQEYTDTYQQITSTGVAGVVMCNQEINFVIDRVVFDNTVPAKEQLTGQYAQARQQRFFDLYDNTTYPNDLFVNDTFTDTDGQWLYSHTGETGATWSIIEDSATWPAFIISNVVQTPNDTGITKWQASGTPGVFGADYAVQADLYAPTTNYSFNGIGARWALDTVMKGYALCLTRDFGSGSTVWQLRQYDNGWTDLGQSTSYVPAAGTTARARIEVEGTGSHVFIRCYADGNLILSVVDKSTSRITNAYQAGIAYQLASANWNVVDNFTAGWPSLLPPGQVALTGFSITTAKGNVTPEVPLTGYAGTTGYGATLPVIDVVPLGRSATTAQGTIVGAPAGNIEIGLTGYAATTGYGQLGLEYVYATLTGQAATAAQGAVEQGRAAELVGQAAAAYDGQLGVDHRFVYDTLTQSSGNLTAHTGEVGATWTIAYQTNTSCKYEFTVADYCFPAFSSPAGRSLTYASGAPTSADQVIVAVYQNAANNAGVAGTISEGVVARLATDGSAGYIFGRNDYDNLWQIDKIGTGALASAATGTLSAYTDIELTFVVTGGATTTLKGYVNGTEVLSVTDSTSPVTAANRVGVHSHSDGNASGAFTQFTALRAGAETSLRLTGQRATGAVGVFDPAARMGYLDGYAATTAQGALTPRVVMGLLVLGTISPHQTQTEDPDNTADFPGVMSTGFIPVNGLYVGVGEFLHDGGYPTKRGDRRGLYKVAQYETTAWTDDGNPVGDDLSPFNAPPNYTTFPRLGSATAYTYRFNQAYYGTRGFISADPDGNVQTAAVRGYIDASTAFTTKYLTWQAGDLTADYAGPELLYITYNASMSPMALRTDPVGLYAVKTNEALAFYPVLHDANVTGAHVRLAGHKATANQGALVRSSSYSEGVELVGLAAIARAYDSYNNDTTFVSAPFNTANDAHAALTGLHTTTYSASLYPEYSHLNAPLAMRRMRDGAWGGETILSGFTGAAHSWVIPGKMRVVHSGYGDTVYVVYLSSDKFNTTTPTHVGLLVLDAVTGTVHSNVLTALTNTVGTWSIYDSVSHEPQQAEAITLANGTSLSQFGISRNIVKLSWTYGTRTTPTLSLKDGPNSSSVVSAWESLEIIGDNVYHVFGNETSGGVYNDVTGAGSTWTSYTGTVSGDSIGGLGIYESHDYFGAATVGGAAWRYDQINGYGIVGQLNMQRTASRWVDFWSAQPSTLSVATAGRVGRVTISATPNVALTGLRATTAADILFPLKDGDAHAAFTGKRTTSRAGRLHLTEIDFVYDSFTEPAYTGTLLTDHTGEVGATWTEYSVSSQYEIYYNEVIPRSYSLDNYGVAWASGVPPSADYAVEAMVSGPYNTTTYSSCINDGLGVRIGSFPYWTTGYYFGWNHPDRKYYLFKNGQSGTPLASADSPNPSVYVPNLWRVEVSGSHPTTIRCYVDDLLLIEYVDSDSPVTAPGRAGFSQFAYYTPVRSVDLLRAFSIDGSALKLEGQRATLAQGVFMFSLDGEAATTAQGVLTPEVWYGGPLTGLAATTAAGLVDAPDRTVALTGLAATTDFGEVSPQPPIVVALTGLAAVTAKGYVWFGGAQLEGRMATLQWGFLEVSSSESEELVGAALASAQGTVTPDVSTSTLGRSATMDRGVLTLVVAVPYWKLLSQATASAGVLTPSTVTTIQLTGHRATTAQGNLTPLSEKSNAATGYVAPAVSGAVTVEVVVSLVGQRGVSTAGTTLPLVVVTPQGRSAVCAQGVHQLLTNIFLTGKAGTCAIGSVGYAYGSTAIVQGAYSKGEVGDVTKTFLKPREGDLLWVFTEPEEPEAAADDEREYVLVAPRG